VTASFQKTVKKPSQITYMSEDTVHSRFWNTIYLAFLFSFPVNYFSSSLLPFKSTPTYLLHFIPLFPFVYPHSLPLNRSPSNPLFLQTLVLQKGLPSSHNSSQLTFPKWSLTLPQAILKGSFGFREASKGQAFFQRQLVDETCISISVNRLIKAQQEVSSKLITTLPNTKRFS
jgi:hypothetical protein